MTTGIAIAGLNLPVMLARFNRSPSRCSIIHQRGGGRRSHMSPCDSCWHPNPLACHFATAAALQHQHYSVRVTDMSSSPRAWRVIYPTLNTETNTFCFSISLRKCLFHERFVHWMTGIDRGDLRNWLLSSVKSILKTDIIRLLHYWKQASYSILLCGENKRETMT